MRIGIGYDVHRLIEQGELIIGGVQIPYHKGLLGHSDADVLCHAIMDAILGAANLGDIGRHFPDDDKRFKDISSIRLLKYTGEILSGERYKIINIDSIIMAEEPKMAGYIDEMRQKIAMALDIATGQISVKATTTEGLGIVGAGAAISSQAAVLIERDNI